MLPALYELTEEYLEAEEKLRDLDIDDETIRDTLEGLQFPIEQKATNVAFVIRNMESLAEQIKQAEQQMAARRKAIEKRAESIRSYLLHNMERCEISKIESPYFKISIRQNPAKVVIDDPVRIPCEFYRYPDAPPPEPDKKAIKEVLESGGFISGAHIEKTKRIEIK